MHILNALLVTAVHVKIKLGENNLNNERLLLNCNDETSDKKLTNCSSYFPALQCINNLETKRAYKRKVNLKNIEFSKNLSSGLKTIR